VKFEGVVGEFEGGNGRLTFGVRQSTYRVVSYRITSHRVVSYHIVSLARLFTSMDLASGASTVSSRDE
jgi:hypothetical protein